MTPIDDETLRAWLAHHGNAPGKKTPEQKALFWAWEKITDLVDQDPEQGWAAILALIAMSENDWQLGNIAAGPLEDLLTAKPEQFRDVVDERARRDPKFRRCLSGVWLTETSPLYSLLQKYAKTVADPL